MTARGRFLIGLGMAAWIAAAYLPVFDCGFINCFDDSNYVTENPAVQSESVSGLLQWAFTSYHCANWHPLTWLSHALDCRLFGLNPVGHHVTSLLLHVLNCVILWVLFNRLTGKPVHGSVVTLLFGLHPLHVESVAWVAERKDVLSALFGLLSLLAYASWIGSRRLTNYLAALVLLALGLMAKPMLVSVPALMLLIDYWPAGRFAKAGVKGVGRLILEKLPFGALAGASCAATWAAQTQGGAVSSVDGYALAGRVANALVSYGAYVTKTFWPVRLAAFYPVPLEGYPWWQIVASAGFMLGATWFVIRFRSKYPYMLMGWLWFVITLVPVIGLVQVGAQAMADRYMYLPSVGLFAAIVWGIGELMRGQRASRVAIAVASAVLVALSSVTYQQVRYWRSGTTLFQHAISVTKNNYMAYTLLGVESAALGQPQEAIKNYHRALALRPNSAMAHSNLGVLLLNRGEVEDAIDHLMAAHSLRPKDTKILINLGNAVANAGRYTEAAGLFMAALKQQPDNVAAHYNLANVLLSMGDIKRAEKHYREAVRIDPRNARAQANLGEVLGRQGRFEEALGHYRTALRLAPKRAETHCGLATTLEEMGHTKEARDGYRAALKLDYSNVRAANNLAWLLATDKRLRDPNAAVVLGERACGLTNRTNLICLDTLAAAYASAGRFDDAIRTARLARSIAEKRLDTGAVKELSQRIELYRQGKPLTVERNKMSR